MSHKWVWKRGARDVVVCEYCSQRTDARSKKRFQTTCKENPNMIKFYKVWDDYPNRVRAKWGEFGNFYRVNILFDGFTFPSSEHAYQAMKYKHVGGSFINEERFHKIRTAPTCKEAKDWANDPNFPIDPDWDALRVDIMYWVVRAKFTQHEILKEVLLSTGDEEIVEDSPIDSFWGRGPDWKGQNQLGKCLMRLRAYLRSQSSNDQSSPLSSS